MQQENPLRALPSVNELLQDQRLVALRGRARPRARPRGRAQGDRRRPARGSPRASSQRTSSPTRSSILQGTAAPRLRSVLNATGVIVHTNLGRAPLAARALERIQEVAGGYSNLEYDLEEGTRGSRQDHVAPLLRDLTGAEAALVVNNNAAAVLLAVAALAEGRDVVVSRGELVEIGDGFRIPEVLARSGARLVEVGTTNRTRLEDYERAIGDRTAVLLRVHQSNFRVVGFTESPKLEDLVGLAENRGVVLVDDLGSGVLPDIGDEPTVPESLAAGAHIVTFSGDKLFGGPAGGDRPRPRQTWSSGSAATRCSGPSAPTS